MAINFKIKPHTLIVTVGELGVADLISKTMRIAVEDTTGLRSNLKSYDGILSIHQEAAMSLITPLFCPFSERTLYDPTFRIVKATAAEYMSISINSEFVFANFLSLKEDEIYELMDLAKDKGYKIQIYFCIPVNHKTKTLAQIQSMRRDIKEISSIISVPERERLVIRAEVEEWDLYQRCKIRLAFNQTLAVIGDVHEHVDALRSMTELLRNKNPNVVPVLVGDWIDKGNNTEAIIDEVEKFIEAGGIVVHGNHESYAVKRIRAWIKGDEVLERDYMTSCKTLLKDKGLADRVLDIFENKSVPFLRVESEGIRTVYVTHAPCKERYLGKIHTKALVKQRNVSGDRNSDYREAYSYIFREADENKPFHLFGHVAHCAEKLQYKNKFFLDTGAVYGNKLTAFTMDSGKAPNLISISTQALMPKKLKDNLCIPLDSTSENSLV